MKRVIRQEDLQDYRELQQMQAWIDHKRQKLRRKILALVKSKAVVEAGELTAVMKQVRARVLKHEKVEAAVGPKMLAELLRRVEPTVTEQLWVKPRPKPRRRRPEPAEAVDDTLPNPFD